MSKKTTGILVRAPGRETAEPLELGEDEHVLVGRRPDWARVADPPPAGSSRSVVIPLPSVSANHVRVHRDHDGVHVADLGSRNGTWVAIPPHGSIIATGGSNAITLHLSPPSSPDAEAEVPAQPHWTGRASYVQSVVAALTDWLEARDLPARVTVIANGERRDDAVGRLPLATGSDLLLEPTRTVGPNWLDALAVVERWVGRQNLLFETEETMREEGLVVASQAMRNAVARVVDAAASGARSLLLTGPSGAGKEGLARLFHRNTRRAGPFVARNCAMLSKELVRTELFGAEKGAFTGSVQRIVGAVETANEGTLFLDELGELPKDVQPMLLRFLDHGEYERLGSYGQPRRADVRIIAATNRDLRAASAKDEFRADLWFRLSVHVVDVPPLRERADDIIAYLRSHPIAKGKVLFDALGPGTLDLLLRHAWEGNFRELVNFSERTAPHALRGLVTPDLAERLLREGSLSPPRRQSMPHVSADSEPDAERYVALIRKACEAFVEDHEDGVPRTWDEIKDLVENYVKPVLFAELSESASSDGIEGVDLRTAAEHLHADRGTALKQLRRFFDRFGHADPRRPAP